MMMEILFHVLSTRDDFNPNLDLIGIFLDTYNDKQNGSFGVTRLEFKSTLKYLIMTITTFLTWFGTAKHINQGGWFVEVKYHILQYVFLKRKFKIGISTLEGHK